MLLVLLLMFFIIFVVVAVVGCSVVVSTSISLFELKVFDSLFSASLHIYMRELSNIVVCIYCFTLLSLHNI